MGVYVRPGYKHTIVLMMPHVVHVFMFNGLGFLYWATRLLCFTLYWALTDLRVFLYWVTTDLCFTLYWAPTDLRVFLYRDDLGPLRL